MARLAVLAVLAVVLAAPAAHAECAYEGGRYQDPDSWAGLCVIDPAVPLGCPIHVIAPHAREPRPAVTRSNKPIALTSQTALVATADVHFATKDVYSCTCDPLVLAVSFDRLELTIAGLRVGDQISFPDQAVVEPSGAVIVAAGPCPEVVWPTAFNLPTACDLCPAQPPEEPPVIAPDHDASCSTARGPGGALASGLVVLALGFVARRRRAPSGAGANGRVRAPRRA